MQQATKLVVPTDLGHPLSVHHWPGQQFRCLQAKCVV
jgi:hypothetical protein